MSCRSSLSTCEYTGINVKVANYSRFPFESNLSMVDTITSKKEFRDNRSNYYRMIEDNEKNLKSSSVVPPQQKPSNSANPPVPPQPSNPVNPPVPPQPAGAAQPKAERYGTDEQLDNAELYDYEKNTGSKFENFSKPYACYTNSGSNAPCSNSATDLKSTPAAYTCSFSPYGDSCRREKFFKTDLGDGDLTLVTDQNQV